MSKTPTAAESTAAASAPTASEPPPAAQSPVAAPTPPRPAEPSPTWDGKLESLDPEVRKIVKRYQDEAAGASAKARATAREEAQQEVLRKLGLAQGDERPDPEALAEQLAAARDETVSVKRERAAERAARRAGLDADALLDSRAFDAQLRALDPAAPDFAQRLDALVAESAQNNPKLKTVLAAAASGVDAPAGSGEAPAAGTVDEMRRLLHPKD